MLPRSEKLDETRVVRRCDEENNLLCRTLHLLRFWFPSADLGQYLVPRSVLFSLRSFLLRPILLLPFFLLLGTNSFHLSFLHDIDSSVSAKSYPFLVFDDVCVSRFNELPLSINENYAAEQKHQAMAETVEADSNVTYVRRQVIGPAEGIMDIMGRLRPLELRVCQRVTAPIYSTIYQLQKC